MSRDAQGDSCIVQAQSKVSSSLLRPAWSPLLSGTSQGSAKPLLLELLQDPGPETGEILFGSHREQRLSLRSQCPRTTLGSSMQSFASRQITDAPPVLCSRRLSILGPESCPSVGPAKDLQAWEASRKPVSASGPCRA